MALPSSYAMAGSNTLTPARRLLLWGLLSLLTTIINPPLARFPGQDLLWNDLILAGRVAWASTAITTHHPFASIDFLEGTGADVIHDVKNVHHFYDPAVFLSLFTDVANALWLRAFLLTLYCLLCLDLMWRQQAGDEPWSARREALRSALSFFYVLTPQLFGDVAHHFSAVFYAMPGVVAALHAWLRRPCARSGCLFVAAATVFINLSDLHVVFLSASLGAFLLLFDPRLRRAGAARILAPAICLCVILFASYLRAVSIFSGAPAVVVARGSWPLGTYMTAFVRPALTSLVFPVFSGPVSLYIAPYLPVFGLIALRSRRDPRLSWQLAQLVLLFASLFALGLVAHDIPGVRDRLPSALRYHLAIIPFLASLWMLFNETAITKAFEEVAGTRRACYMICAITVVAFFAATAAWFSPKGVGYIAIGGHEVDATGSAARGFLFLALVLYPSLFTAFAALGARIRRAGPAFGSLAVVGATALLYVIRAYGFPLVTYTDSGLFRALYRNAAIDVEAMIQHSRYRAAPRSIIPIARPTLGPPYIEGRNDKLLPMVELPEQFGGRSFFQWRYSYSRHTSALYAAVTRTGPVMFFPPIPYQLPQALELARSSQSPFLVSADRLITDDRLDLLGHYTVENEVLRNHPYDHTGLRGNVYIYGIKELAPGTPSSPFARVDYSRVTVHLQDLQPTHGIIRLPISYFADLTVRDERGRRVEPIDGYDGFAYVRNDGSFRALTVSSFSVDGVLALLAPLAGLLTMWVVSGAMRLRRRRRLEPETCPAR